MNVTGNVAFGVTDVGVADLSFSVTANTSVSAVVKPVDLEWLVIETHAKSACQ